MADRDEDDHPVFKGITENGSALLKYGPLNICILRRKAYVRKVRENRKNFIPKDSRACKKFRDEYPKSDRRFYTLY